MSRAGCLFSRGSLSRVVDRLAQNIGHELQPRDVQNAQGCGGQTVNSVGGGGERWGEEGRVCVRWKTKRTGVIIQRTFLDCIRSHELLGLW